MLFNGVKKLGFSALDSHFRNIRKLSPDEIHSHGVEILANEKVVNAAPDLAPASGPPSTASSDNLVFEFTKVDVEALLAEKLKTKNKFNTKEKCDLMSEYIRRLKLCIKWFQ